MASENIDQIFTGNPITANVSTDLMYFGQSPYGAGDDAAMTFANFAAQFMLAGSGVTPAQVQNQAFTYNADIGTLNNVVILVSPTPAAYADGQLFSFRAKFANTGATTFETFGLAAKPLVTNANAALTGGEILLNGDYIVMYNATFGAFVLMNSSASGGAGVTAAQIQGQAFTYGGVTGGTTNALTMSLTPPITSYQDGQLFSLVQGQNSNTGPVTINVDSVGVVPIVTAGNVALTANQMLVVGTYLIQYNSIYSSFILLNPNSSGGGSVTPAQIQQQSFNYAIDSSGTANQVTVAYTPPITSLTDGLSIWFQAANSSVSGSATITVDALSPVTLLSNDGLPIAANFLVANSVYNAIYNAFSASFFVTNPFSVAVAEFYGFVQQEQIAVQQFVYGNDTGSANHYAVNGTYFDQISSPFSMAAGFYLSFIAAHTNTGASDMTIGLGSVTSNIMKNSAAGLVALTAANITAGNTYQMITSGSGPSAVWVLMN